MTGAGGMAQSGMLRQRRRAWAVPLDPAAGIGEQALVNYRHAFHAGNFADLVKHAALPRLLARLMADPSPLTEVDTRAGAQSARRRQDLSGFAVPDPGRPQAPGPLSGLRAPPGRPWPPGDPAEALGQAGAGQADRW